MILTFTKMNGAGNDFVLADNRAQNLRLTGEQIIQLCHRQRGVGADGLILLIPCTSGKADWAWEFYNSDGSAADMCGNGARCFARYVRELVGAKETISFETGAGVIHTTFHRERVTVSLTNPRDFKLEQKITLSDGGHVIHSVNTGVPHAVLFVPDADLAMVQPLGREIRHHAHFAPKGTNVNFVQQLGPGGIRVRTYERGVEGETLACGTGVTASALVSARLHHFSSPVKVQVQSGDFLEVGFKETGGEFNSVQLTGPADFVFTGQIKL